MTTTHAGTPVKLTPNLELEGVRGIACVLVLLSHTLYLTHLDPTTTLPAWLRTLEAGHIGVLVFFLLSGYLIGWTNSSSYTPERRRAYVTRRLLRLGPIYYVALILTVAVIWLRSDHGQLRTIGAAALGLQNFNDYFGLHVSVPMSNGPLWSLNYELLYYALFLVVWRFRLSLGWVFLPTLAMTLLVWFFPAWMPLFLGSYACGWLFWAAGWWLSHQPELPPGTPRPVLSWLLLVYASHHLEGMMRFLNVLHLHNPDAGMVTLGQVGALSPILLLLAAASGRRLPGERIFSALAWLFCLVPLAGMIATGRLWADPSWMASGVAVLLAGATWSFKHTAWLKSFAWLGSISYAIYVVHFPLLFVVARLPLPRGTLPAYTARIAIWAALTLVLAWFLEKKFQPWAKSFFPQPKAT